MEKQKYVSPEMEISEVEMQSFLVSMSFGDGGPSIGGEGDLDPNFPGEI